MRDLVITDKNIFQVGSGQILVMDLHRELFHGSQEQVSGSLGLME